MSYIDKRRDDLLVHTFHRACNRRNILIHQTFHDQFHTPPPWMPHHRSRLRVQRHGRRIRMHTIRWLHTFWNPLNEMTQGLLTLLNTKSAGLACPWMAHLGTEVLGAVQKSPTDVLTKQRSCLTATNLLSAHTRNRCCLACIDLGKWLHIELITKR